MVCSNDRLEFAFDVFSRCQRPVGIMRTVYSGGYMSVNHRHDFPQIWYCHSGRYQHRIDEVTYDCPEGSLVIIPIGADHQFWCEEDVDIIFLNIDYELFKGIDPNRFMNLRINLFLSPYFEKLGLTFTPFRILGNGSRKIAEQIFSWLFLQEHTFRSANSTELAISKLEELFSLPELKIPKASCKKSISVIEKWLEPILTILDFLNANYSANITDEALLQQVDLSRAAMYRHFKHIVKYTYYQYLQMLRTKHAHCLLRDTVYSNSKIAALCGFGSTYHMTQSYTRFLGKEIKAQRLHFERKRQNQQDN